MVVPQNFLSKFRIKSAKPFNINYQVAPGNTGNARTCISIDSSINNQYIYIKNQLDFIQTVLKVDFDQLVVC